MSGFDFPEPLEFGLADETLMRKYIHRVPPRNSLLQIIVPLHVRQAVIIHFRIGIELQKRPDRSDGMGFQMIPKPF